MFATSRLTTSIKNDERLDLTLHFCDSPASYGSHVSDPSFRFPPSNYHTLFLANNGLFSFSFTSWIYLILPSWLTIVIRLMATTSLNSCGAEQCALPSDFHVSCFETVVVPASKSMLLHYVFQTTFHYFFYGCVIGIASERPSFHYRKI